MTSFFHRRLFGLALLAATACMNARAGTMQFSGSLNDPANLALKSSDLTAASFASTADVADNVALYTFSLAIGGPVTISTADGVAGVDPYFTLFQGGTSTATFAASNYTHAYFTAGGDFSLPLTLTAGTYTLALGTFANMSFAEDRGTGTLADGFIHLGQTTSLGNGFYQINVTTAAVPEPATALLLAAGVVGVGLSMRRSR